MPADFARFGWIAAIAGVELPGIPFAVLHDNLNSQGTLAMLELCPSAWDAAQVLNLHVHHATASASSSLHSPYDLKHACGC